MNHLRSLSATLLSAVTTFSLVSASSCGTSATGVDDCRDIQRARCRAGKVCGIVSDVAACERYYRDHCLHGLSVSPPPSASVAACVDVIEAAGQCAASDPESTLADCDDAVTARQPGLVYACDVIKHPERAAECTFLTDTPPEEGDGQAGQSAGGQSGQGATGTSGAESAGDAAVAGAAPG